MPWYAAGAELLTRSRAHWKSFALFLLIGGVAGGLTALLRHPVYRSGAAFRAEPRVDWQGSNVAVWVQPNAQFLADLLRSDTVLRRVASGTFPTNEHFTIGQLRGAINVSVNYRTWVVSFSVDARTPQLAQALAESTLAALTAANVSPQLRAQPDRPRRRPAVLLGLLIGAAVALVRLVLEGPSAAPAYRTARAESPC